MGTTLIGSRLSVSQGCMFAPASKGVTNLGNLTGYSRQRLPTDPIGTHALTLQNVVVGSHINIMSQDGTTTHYMQQYGPNAHFYDDPEFDYDDTLGVSIYDSETDVPITINVYQAGSPLNDWRIRIRKGSDAPYYMPYETLLTVAAGSSSLYISQIPD